MGIEVIRIFVLLLSASTILLGQSNLRYSEPIPAMDFFERCNISAYLDEYCNPGHNLGIRNVNVGCGSGRIDVSFYP